MRRLTSLPVVLISLAVAACGGAVRREPIVEFKRAAAEYVVRTPAKAQLADGSLVLYRQGVTVTPDALEGAGTRFSLTLDAGNAVTRVPFDSVVSLVSLSPLQPPKKKGLSTEASVPITMGVIILAFAFFSVTGSN